MRNHQTKPCRNDYTSSFLLFVLNSRSNMGATQSKSSEPVIFYNQSSPLQVRFAEKLCQIGSSIDILFLFSSLKALSNMPLKTKRYIIIADTATHWHSIFSCKGACCQCWNQREGWTTCQRACCRGIEACQIATRKRQQANLWRNSETEHWQRPQLCCHGRGHWQHDSKVTKVTMATAAL